MNPSANPHILYVLGDARCGSTLLSISLGHALGAAHCGELKNAPERAWLKSEICSCGEPGRTCPLWRETKRLLTEDCGANAAEELAHLQTAFDRLRSLPAALFARLVNSRRWQRYCELNAAFLRALAQAHGSNLLVDNSKNIARAMALQTMPRLNVRFIHTTRDPRGAVWSQARYLKKDLTQGINRDRQPLPAWRVSLAWCFNNLAPLFLRSRFVFHVSHEAFVLHPDATMKVCAKHLGMPDQPLNQVEGTLLDPRLQHVISGNRLRMQPDIRIQSSDLWAREIPASMASRTWLMTGWLARRFGYKRLISKP